MDTVCTQIDNQKAVWTGTGGQNWVEAQDLLDQMFKPLEELLVERVCAVSPCQVLDVGCGTGGTTLAVARHLAATASCVGIDVSGPMLDAARSRTQQGDAAVQFIEADAQTHAFSPARFDTIISRMGVMFFSDFTAAFANLRRAAKRDATLAFIAWRAAEENPFMTAAERAAAPFLPILPPRLESGPGQFAFADEHRVHRILEDGGWAGVDIEPADFTCTFPEDELIRYITLLGPVGRALREADEQTQATVIEAVRPAFEPYVIGGEVSFTAACWMVSARAGE